MLCLYASLLCAVLQVQQRMQLITGLVSMCSGWCCGLYQCSSVGSGQHARAAMPDLHTLAVFQLSKLHSLACFCRSFLPRLAPIWFGYPFADLSYWVALVFTLGCVAWVINGHYALYDVGAAVATNAKQAATVVTAAAFIGGRGHTDSVARGPGVPAWGTCSRLTPLCCALHSSFSSGAVKDHGLLQQPQQQ